MGLGVFRESCGTGTAIASEHSAMAINGKHFHDSVCILEFLLVWFLNKSAKEKTKKENTTNHTVNAVD